MWQNVFDSVSFEEPYTKGLGKVEVKFEPQTYDCVTYTGDKGGTIGLNDEHITAYCPIIDYNY